MLYVSAVIIIALALLSPLPFISPFDYIIQDATAQNIPLGTSSFEIIPNLIVSPFGVIKNGVNGFNSIGNPIQINTFQIGDSIYAGVYTSANSGVFTIINITDPSSPSLVSVLNSTVNSLFTIYDATYTVIDGSTYALAVSYLHDHVLIINVTNPSLPSLVTYITDGADYTTLDGPYSIATVKIDSSTFALVTAFFDHGVQIIDITDPSDPIPASAITDGNNGYTELGYAYDITTVTINSSTYALVASIYDRGVQIIDITDPYNPIAASALSDNVDNYTALGSPRSIAIVKIDSSTFALVASLSDSGVVQIIDITDPYNPIAASAISDGDDYTELRGAMSITTVKIGSSIFALVASFYDDGVQIIDIIDPYNPLPVYAVSEGVDGYTELTDAHSITAVTIGTSTYALVASFTDHGIQIIKLEQEYMPVYSSNQNPKYAKAGDTLGINFNTTDIIASHTGQILGLNVSATVNDTEYDATVIVPSTPRESYATFTIQVANVNGTSVTLTENDFLPKNNVFVDTISPSIELVGSANYIIPYGTLDPSIPNVTVSDGDPNYLSGFTLVKSAPVDTRIPGSIYNYTYTANPDRSGNAGNSVTRTILVVNNTSCMDSDSSYNIIPGDDSSKVLNGTADNDLIYGTEGDDIINGLGGNDCIIGNGGNDVIDGGDGHDVIHGGYGDDIIKGGSDNDVIYGGNGEDIINGNNGDDELFGDTGDDTINGNGGNDIISGGFGHDAILGGPDDDTLYGGDGDDTIDGNNGNDLISGEFGDDVITGGSGKDTINGNDGNDEIFGGGSDDTINGNGGNDIIFGGFGHDSILGGPDDDTLYGENGKDTINGNDGDDELFGGSDDDTMNGNVGNDVITGGSGRDMITGGPDDDTIYGGGGDDTIDGNNGNDIISGEFGHDVIKGGSGKDTINGNDGNDELFGGGSDDTINGNNGNDIISGGFGHDIIKGGNGDDALYGQGDDDTLYGEGGDDTISGNDGNDLIYGGSGHDMITGGNGDDTIDGQYGNDVISGGDGDDILNGGGGDNTITGGPGNNTIIP